MATPHFVDMRDLSDVIWLRELLDASRVANLAPEQHPLAQGFAALRKLEKGEKLSPSDAIEFGNLQLTARAVHQTEAHWKPYREHLIADLLKAAECVAIIFEIEVMQFSLEGTAASVLWNRYEDGGNDIVLDDPAIHVECLCIRSKEPEIHLDDLRKKVKQRNVEAPYVVAIGFARDVVVSAPFTKWEDVLRPRMNEWDDWFGRHTEISASLLFLPQRIDFSAPENPKFPGYVPVKQGQIVELHNQLAAHPLPEEYRFGTE